MKKIIVLYLLISYNCLAQNNELNKIFFDIPLHSSRDSIYNFCTNSSFITKVKNRGLLTKKGVEIKTFNGYHNKLESVDSKLDSIQFQLSSGSKTTEGEEGHKELLVFFIDYIISDKKYSKVKYEELKTKLNEFAKKTSYTSLIRNENGRTSGKNDRWFLNNGLELNLEYEIITRNKYNIRIEYNRIE